MFGLEGILASVVLPAVIDLVKGAAGAASKRWIGLSVDDEIKLADANVRKLEALAKLDNPYGSPSLWVVNLRAAFRYVLAAALVCVGSVILVAGLFKGNDTFAQVGFNLAAMPWSFIFGERMWNGLKGAPK